MSLLSKEKRGIVSLLKFKFYKLEVVLDSIYKNKAQPLLIFCLLLLSIGGFLLWVKSTNFYHCLAFSVTKSAQSSFVCGNYYFGVYDVSRYDINRAEYYFAKAIEIDSTTPDAWHQYARIAFLKGDYLSALHRINRQFEERGDELMAAYYIRGLIYGYAKNYPEAEKDFLKFLEWSPNNWAANNDLAWIYFAQGKFKEAEELSALSLKRDPFNPWLLMMHAMSAYNLGDVETAKKELQLAKLASEGMTEERWIHAYPGNDPEIAKEGLAEFRKAIEQNIELVGKASSTP